MPRQGGAGEGAPAGGGGTLRKRGRGAPWRATGANAARGNAQPGEGGAGAGGGGAGGTPRPPGASPRTRKSSPQKHTEVSPPILRSLVLPRFAACRVSRPTLFSFGRPLFSGVLVDFVWKFHGGTTAPPFSNLRIRTGNQLVGGKIRCRSY